MSITSTAILINARNQIRQYGKLRKFTGNKSWCPDCGEKTLNNDDIFGNNYCGKCGIVLGFAIKERTKKEQEKWLKS
jgi:ribosomal protein S27AE